ncbi:MAG: TIGR01777 family oxidoreductase [Polyangiaceae bacterium]
MTRVLVTGGTGFIGRALAEALSGRGDEPVIVSRSARPPAVGWDAIQREVEGVEAVVHLAGEPIADGRWTSTRLERIRASRVESTEQVAAAIARASRRPRVFVSGSAVGIYGMRNDDHELDEDGPPGDDVLARIVVAWEAAAHAARAAGVRVVHPRTGVVLGRSGGALPKMAAPFKWFVGGTVGSGRQWVSWVHLSDVVRALLFAIDSDALVGPVNVVAPAPVTMETLTRCIGRALKRPAIARVPPFALRVALGKGLAQMLLTGQRVVPRRLLDAGFAFDFPAVEEACADLL